jgi:hypothetical protein
MKNSVDTWASTSAEVDNTQVYISAPLQAFMVLYSIS